MVFNFDHNWCNNLWEINDYKDLKTNVIQLKTVFNNWQEAFKDKGFLPLNWLNHDQPRLISHYGNMEYFKESGKMLATALYLMRGMPFIYQGEEIGMTNPSYTSIEQYNDIETHNNYRIMLENGYSEEKAFEIILAKSRDNSRTPMQWDDSEHAGFTTGKPWLEVATNYPEINVKNELANGRIFPYYQKLISLRKEYDVISTGTYRGLLLDHPQIMAYVREWHGQQLLVMSHFYRESITVSLPEEFKGRSASKLIGNGPLENLSDELTFGPFETVAFLFD